MEASELIIPFILLSRLRTQFTKKKKKEKKEKYIHFFITLNIYSAFSDSMSNEYRMTQNTFDLMHFVVQSVANRQKRATKIHKTRGGRLKDLILLLKKKHHYLMLSSMLTKQTKAELLVAKYINSCDLCKETGLNESQQDRSDKKRQVNLWPTGSRSGTKYLLSGHTCSA